MVRLSFVALFWVACTPGGGTPQASQAAYLLDVTYSELQPDGTVMQRSAANALDPQNNAPIKLVKAGGATLVIKAAQRPYLEREGVTIPEAIAGTVDEYRRLRDLDEGFYRIEKVLPGSADDPTQRWTIKYEPHSDGLMARPFNISVLNGQPRGRSLELKLLFVPPDAPAFVSVQRAGSSQRTITWMDKTNTESGFDILAAAGPSSSYYLAGRVGVDGTTFTTSDRSVVPQEVDLYWQVCARGASLPRCSAAVKAAHIGSRQPENICGISGNPPSIEFPLSAVQSQDNANLYHAMAPELGSTVGANRAASTTGIRNPATFPIEIRDRGTTYRTVPAGGRIDFYNPIMEGPWMVRVPSGTTPAPTSLLVVMEYCI